MKFIIITIMCITMPQIIFAADFRQASWGMSKQQVIKLEGKQPNQNDATIMMYKSTLAGIPCLVSYMFESGKLASGGYYFTARYIPAGKYIDDYYSLEKLLRKKYGAGRNADVWYNDIYRSDASMLGMALRTGNAKKMTMWEIHGNRITHVLQGGRSFTHAISYSSIKNDRQKSKRTERQTLKAL